MAVVALRVDYVVLICKGCKVERRFTCNPILRGAVDVERWLKTKPTACVCGAKTCDVKMHIMEDN